MRKWRFLSWVLLGTLLFVLAIENLSPRFQVVAADRLKGRVFQGGSSIEVKKEVSLQQGWQTQLELKARTDAVATENFPLGWYDNINRQKTPAAVADEGMNLLVPYTGDSDFAKIAAYLDAAEAAGVKVMLELPREIVRAGDEEAIAQFVERFKDRAALYGWYLYDEPENEVSPERLRQAYEAIKSEDAQHPVAVAFFDLKIANRYRGALDIFLHHYYPLDVENSEFGGRRWRAFDQQIRAAANTAARVVESRQNFWFTVQAFEQQGGNRSWRLPSATEERYMVYTAVLQGAKGLLFWAHYRAPQPWIDAILNPIVREFQSYAPAFNNPVGEKIAVNGGKLLAKLYQDPTTEKYILLAINDEPQTIQPNISLSSDLNLARATLMASQSTISVEDDVFNDTFAPYEVRIYTLE